MLSFPTHAQCKSLTSLFQGRAAPLAERARVRQVHAGEVVYAMGDPTDHLYYVIGGRVRTSILSPGGKEYVMGLYGSGELVGELCFCSVRRRHEQAVAATEAGVVRLEVSHLVNQIAGDKTAVADLLEQVCHRMGDLQNHLAELSLASVRTRLGFLLLRLAEDGPEAPGGRRQCCEQLTHEELAARVATTREQVSAILAHYREQGFIDYRRGSPILIDVRRLTEHLQNLA